MCRNYPGVCVCVGGLSAWSLLVGKWIAEGVARVLEKIFTFKLFNGKLQNGNSTNVAEQTKLIMRHPLTLCMCEALRKKY